MTKALSHAEAAAQPSLRSLLVQFEVATFVVRLPGSKRRQMPSETTHKQRKPTTGPGIRIGRKPDNSSRDGMENKKVGVPGSGGSALSGGRCGNFS